MVARDYIDTLALPEDPEDESREAEQVKAAKALRRLAPKAVAASQTLAINIATEAVLRALGLK